MRYDANIQAATELGQTQQGTGSDMLVGTFRCVYFSDDGNNHVQFWCMVGRQHSNQQLESVQSSLFVQKGVLGLVFADANQIFGQAEKLRFLKYQFYFYFHFNFRY